MRRFLFVLVIVMVMAIAAPAAFATPEISETLTEDACTLDARAGYTADANVALTVGQVEEALQALYPSLPEQLIPHPDGPDAVLTAGVFRELLETTVRTLAPEFAPLFQYGGDATGDFAIGFTGRATDGTVPYGAAVEALRLLGQYLHQEIGLQWDREKLGFVNDADLLAAVQEAFPEWTPSEFLLVNYGNSRVDKTLYGGEAITLFRFMAEELLGTKSVYADSDIDWSFGLPLDARTARIRRADVPVFTAEELRVAVTNFVALIKDMKAQLAEPPVSFPLVGGSMTLVIESPASDPTLGSAILAVRGSITEQTARHLQQFFAEMGLQIK